MVVVVLFIVFILAYAGLPKAAKLVVLIANFFIVDPIPYVDEVIMVALLLGD